MIFQLSAERLWACLWGGLQVQRGARLDFYLSRFAVGATFALSRGRVVARPDPVTLSSAGD